MILDSSAVLAILREEPEVDDFIRLIDQAEICRISAVNYVESAVVIDSAHDPAASRRFDQFVREAEVRIEPVTVEQAQLAREAYRDFGKGGGHRAKLNFGDCFAYALAKATAEPLLFKGGDFVHTDIERALP